MAASKTDFEYMPGFGNHFSTEAVKGALPIGQNSPQVCAYGLIAEQLSGTAFTVPRVHNQRSWLYRTRPTAGHDGFKKVEGSRVMGRFDQETSPEQIRWMPAKMPEVATDFVQGITTVCGAGSPQSKSGTAIHVYACNADMKDKAFCSADGDLLIVPQLHSLLITTELGRMHVPSGFIALIPRGIRFSVTLPEGEARGYICEVFGGHFRIPDLGPIGANGLANPRDFETPVAWYEDRSCDFLVVQKFMGSLWEAHQEWSPFDVVAWHGNYAPCRYNLAHFNCMNSVTFDHPDPSIYTVLTCPTTEPGVAACDFVIFPPRWCVQEHTFRPPYFHRNCMSEYMGLIRGAYEAKEGGFVAGGASLHSCMTPHGPDKAAFDRASAAELVPVKIAQSDLAFMFESTYLFAVTELADAPHVPRDQNYLACWKGFTSNFKPPASD